METGVKEIDMVMNLGALIDGDYGRVFRDINGVVVAAGVKGSVKV